MKTLIVISSIALLISCQMNFESTLYSDKTISIEVVVITESDALRKSVNDLFHSKNDINDSAQIQEEDSALNNFPKDWTSLYDQMKNLSEKLPDNEDSLRILKMIQIKFGTKDNHLHSVALKINKAEKNDIEFFEELFSEMNPKHKFNEEQSKDINFLNVKWDGKKAIIPADFESFESGFIGNSKSESKESIEMFKQILKGSNIVLTYRFNFEKNIIQVTGKNYFMKKIDNNTIEFKIDFMQMLESKSAGKKIKKSDKEICVIVED